MWLNREFIDKGLKVNAGKSKVMVGRSGGKMIVNSGKWCLWERSVVVMELLARWRDKLAGGSNAG